MDSPQPGAESRDISAREQDGGPDAAVRLYEGGQRLGWEYRDLEAYRFPFPEPAPVRGQVAPELLHALQTAELLSPVRKRSALKSGAALAGVSLLFALVADIFWAAFVLSAAYALISYTRAAQLPASARRAVEQANAQLDAQYQQQLVVWNQGKAAFDAAEDARLGALDQWGSLPVAEGTRRLDVFGGSQRSREALLTVLGASTLSRRPVIVLDLTQAQVYTELAALTSLMGAPVDVQLLPSRQAESSILSGLERDELVDALVESMYGDTSSATRAARSEDTRQLHLLCDALEGEVTLARIAAGLRVLLDEPDDSGCLSRAERRRIEDEVLTDRNRERARDSLTRLEAFVHPLRDLGTERGDRGPGYLTCISLDRRAGSASVELLADLAVLSVTRRLATREETAPAVILALGEEGVQRRYLEQLASVCEWRGAQLTVLHPHLRDSSVDAIGGGTVGFLRLGNHREAAAAADFIGRENRFVLHSLTDTSGRTVSESVAETQGTSFSVGTTESVSRARVSSWNSGDIGGYSSGGSSSATRTNSTTVTRGSSESTTSTEGRTVSTSDGRTTQRVYEYTLEPTQLQGLEDFGVVLVERAANGTTAVRCGSCNPHVVRLERLSNEPLPELPVPPRYPQQQGPAQGPQGPVQQGYPRQGPWPQQPPQQPPLHGGGWHGRH